MQLDFASLAGSGNLQMIALPMAAADSGGKVIYVVEARVRSGTYENRLAGDAVIIHGMKTTTGMAYSMDADVPPANRANNEGSMFKVGETWTSPNGSQRVRVDAQNATGFVVTIGWPGPSTPPSAITAAVIRSAPKAPMSIEVRWTGGAPRMDIFRNGALVRTAEGTNVYVEKYLGGVRPTFRVCNASTAVCTSTVTTQPMRLGGPAPVGPTTRPKPVVAPIPAGSVTAPRNQRGSVFPD